MEGVIIEPLRAGDVPEASTVLARAYCTSPIQIAVFREQDGDLLCQKAMFKKGLEHAMGQVFVARRDGQVIGILRMVEWPRCQMSAEEGRERALLLKDIPQDVTARMREWRSFWAQRDPQKSHWHLGPIAVVPEMQGKGIGSLMLERFCEQVDRSGVAAYLETDKPENVSLYQRFGFSVTEEGEVLGLKNWFMWRAPHQDTP